MVERSDRAPLLDWEEVPSADKPDGDAQVKDRRPPSPSDSRAPSGWGGVPGGPKAGDTDSCGGATPATSGNPADEDDGLRAGDEEHRTDAVPSEALLNDRMVKWEEKDQIVSVFVVTFNTRTGAAFKDAIPSKYNVVRDGSNCYRSN